MKIKFLVAFTLFASSLYAQNIGIGTTTPSNNAILDINSNNKGLMLPRINSTANIANPTAGLFIYNLATNSPSYYNGTQWINLTSSSSTTNADSITYTLSGGTELPANTLYQSTLGPTLPVGGGGGGGGKPQIGDLSFSKFADINTIDLKRATYSGTHFTNIEFKFYKINATTPYYSIKLTDCIMYSYNDLQTNSADGLAETYTLHPINAIGFKDWINNKSFGYTLVSGIVTTY